MQLINFFKSVGLTSKDIEIRISNRMVLETILHNMGIKEDDMFKAFNIIDKIEKIEKLCIVN